MSRSHHAGIRDALLHPRIVSSKRLETLLVATIAFATVPSTPSAAQTLSVAALRGYSDHDLQPRSDGITASLIVPLHPRIGLAVAIDRLRGDQAGAGIVCAGLINPIQCPTEPYAQVGRLTTAAVGADVPLFRRRYVERALRPQVLMGSVKTETLGHETGNTLSASKTVVGLSMTGDVRITPLPRLPIDLVLGAAVRRPPTAGVHVADGYTPFEQWFTSRTVYAGLAVSRRQGP